jgi:hypothetical protein
MLGAMGDEALGLECRQVLADGHWRDVEAPGELGRSGGAAGLEPTQDTVPRAGSWVDFCFHDRRLRNPDHLAISPF